MGGDSEAGREVQLRVRCATHAGETLGVTGSSLALGSWSREGVVQMVKEAGGSDEWTVSLGWVPAAELEEAPCYRYCVLVKLPPLPNGARRRSVVRRWETHLRPRRLGRGHGDDVFGAVDGLVRVQRGWLTEEVVVQLKVVGAGLRLWEERGGSYWLKVTPLARRQQERSVEELRERAWSLPWPIVESAVLTEDRNTREVQGDYGQELSMTDDSFMMFEVQLCDIHLDLLVDIYWQQAGSREAPTLIGLCFLLPDSFKQSLGQVEVPVTSPRHQPIGSLTIDYMVVRPLPCHDHLDFRVSYRNYWSEDWQGLDVGHRGLGNSYTEGQHCSHVRENTLASMRDAIAHGAHMVEFDVQVSSDRVPCVYHEFHLCVLTRAKMGGDVMIDVPVKDLSLAELQGLCSHHPSEKVAGVKTFGENEGKEEHESFPTLKTVLLSLDFSCGFNIEVKYGQTMRDGTEETKINQMEMNDFLDPILECVLHHGGERAIVFSSFNPDICTMLIHKQNKYPVLLLTQGENTKYPDFRDPRTWSLRQGVLFVEMAGLLGLSAMAEALTRDPTQMDMVKKRGQVIFCWTDEDNSKESVLALKNLGVDGVIFDRMDQNKTEMFVAEGRLAGDSPSPPSTPEEQPVLAWRPQVTGPRTRCLSFNGPLES